MTIKGFENEDIEVSEFGEWVGKDYIDYKSEYKEHQKIINVLLKQRQELIEYLKEKKNELYKKLSDYNDLARIGKETDIEFFEALILERKIDVYEEILSKIEKSDK